MTMILILIIVLTCWFVVTCLSLYQCVGLCSSWMNSCKFFVYIQSFVKFSFHFFSGRFHGITQWTSHFQIEFKCHWLCVWCIFEKVLGLCVWCIFGKVLEGNIWKYSKAQTWKMLGRMFGKCRVWSGAHFHLDWNRTNVLDNTNSIGHLSWKPNNNRTFLSCSLEQRVLNGKFSAVTENNTQSNWSTVHIGLKSN